MDAASAPVSATSFEEAPGVLIDLNGRLRGRRRPLYDPSTCLGKSPACDIPLTGNGVAAQHCLIVYAAGRFQLRDLASRTGTKVNGQRVAGCFLQNGDHVVVGSWKFQIVMTAEPHGKTGDSFLHGGSEDSRQSLRIQAAAVVAQQAALTETEFSLAQRKTSLDKQQAQLAAHLEEKRKRLVDLYAQTQQARKLLQKDRESYESQVEQVRNDLSKGQLDLLHEKQGIVQERQRVAKLRKRIRQRYEKHFAQQQQVLQENQSVVAGAYQFLEQQRAQLEQEREGLENACLKYNAEVELGRRRLQSEWEKLRRERARFRSEAKSVLTALEENERSLGHAKSTLRKQQEKYRLLLRDVVRESDCLDNRIHNQRCLAAAQQEEIAGLQRKLDLLRGEAGTITIPTREQKVWPLALPLPQDQQLEVWLSQQSKFAVAIEIADSDLYLLQRLQELDAISDDAEEQCLILAEQWESILEVRQRWRDEQASATQEVSELAARLQTHGASLIKRQQVLESGKKELCNWRNELVELRQHLVGWQSRLRIQDGNWRAERDRRQIELQERTAHVEKQLAGLAELRQRWAERYGQDIEALQNDRGAAAETKKEFLDLCRQCREQIRELQHERRELSGQALSLEQYRQKYLGRTKNPAMAQRRLERLHRRWTKDQAELIEAVQQENQELQSELQQYSEAYGELEKQIDQKHIARAHASDHQAGWEEELLRSRRKQEELLHQVQIAQSLRRRSELQISDLKNELERVARMLLDEPNPPSILLRSEEDAEQTPLPRAA